MSLDDKITFSIVLAGIFLIFLLWFIQKLSVRLRRSRSTGTTFTVNFGDENQRRRFNSVYYDEIVSEDDRFEEWHE